MLSHLPLMTIVNEIINVATCIFIMAIGWALFRGHFHIHHYNHNEK